MEPMLSLLDIPLILLSSYVLLFSIIAELIFPISLPKVLRRRRPTKLIKDSHLCAICLNIF
jgi:hypothetical protein